MSVELVVVNENPQPPIDLFAAFQPEPHEEHWHEEAEHYARSAFVFGLIVGGPIGFVACLVLFGVGDLFLEMVK